MRKMLCWLMLLAVMFSACAGSAEGVTDLLAGRWYVHEVVMDGAAYNLSGLTDQVTVVFDDDAQGGVITHTSGMKEIAFVWMEDGEGTAWLAYPGVKGIIPMEISGDAEQLVLSGNGAVYELGREPEPDTDFLSELRVEYECIAPEDYEGDRDELMGRTIAAVQSRLNNGGYPGSNVLQIGKNGIQVRIPITETDQEYVESVLDLISAPGKLEFLNPEGEVFMTGDMVQTAAYVNTDGDHQIAFELTSAGAELFAEETARSIGRAISIYMDGELLIAPAVQAAITDGRGVINGLDSRELAERMAVQIQSGALPTTLVQEYLDIYCTPSTGDKIAARRRGREKAGACHALTLGDDVRTRQEISDAIDEQLEYMAATYAMYGLPFDSADETYRTQARDEVIRGMKEQMVLDAKVKELKLDELTGEELAAIRENADAQIREDLDIVKEYYLSDEQKALEGEELEKAAMNALTDMGYTPDFYEENARAELINSKLRDYVVKDAEVTGEKGNTEEEGTDKLDTMYMETVQKWIDEADFRENLDAPDHDTAWFVFPLE